MSLNKPDADELEVSVFGPGYGESIVIHIGNGEWVIVDSCIDRKNNQAAALSYLKEIGVTPASDVKLVIATHWHDDHIRGLSKIVEECVEADFVCSTAIKTREFLKLMEVHRHRKSSSTTCGVCEFLSVFNTLKRRDTPPKFAIADRKIWHRPSISETSTDCTIYSLSPSDAEVEMAFANLVELFPEDGANQRRLSVPKQNECAIVIWIDLGHEEIILLGADLEENGNCKTGWSAIVSGHNNAGNKASIYKVPHHGSITGHHQPVWDEMLIEEPWALLTPFTRGSKPLPSGDDIERISRQTPKSYVTASLTQNNKIKRKDKLVKKCIEQYTKYMKVSEPLCGHIRMRRSHMPDTDWSVELHEGACELASQV